MKKSGKRQPKILYFDYAATAPITASAEKAMKLAYGSSFGNPGSIHRAGMNASALLDKARETVALSLGGDFSGIVFTSSATEANNLVIRGVAKKYMVRRRTESFGLPARVIISAAEHESVDRMAEKLSEEGTEVIRVPVYKNGKVNIKALKEALNERTVVVSLIFVNNETGAVNDVLKVSEIIKEKKKGEYPIFHVDASQAFQYEDCSFNSTGADVITLSSHKIGGPKGAGAACFRNNAITRLVEPITYGGGQEFGMRSGTENVPAISGFAVAIKEADSLRNKEIKRVSALKKILIREIERLVPKAEVNGPELEESSPHILNVWLPGISAEEIIVAMDMEGSAISYGSACSARAFRQSRILRAMGHKENRARESVRISLGRETKMEDIRKFVIIFKKVIAKF
ncbi:MAG: cysteine desulfurase family protein [Parcubacteria group bacterium]